MRIRLAVLTSVSSLLLAQTASSEEVEGKSEKSLSALVQLNRAALFGSHAEVKEGRVTLRFPADGSFGASFASRSTAQRGFIAEPKLRNTVTVRQVLHEVDKQAACAAIQSGSAVSRFELADDVKLRFKIKAPNVARGSTLGLRLNVVGPRSFIDLANFQIVTVRGGKRPIRQVTKLPEYQGHWSSWFDRKAKHGVEFEVAFKGGKLSLKTFVAKEGEKEPTPIELVTVEGIETPRSGKILWMFKNVSFALTDLVIEGKYSQEWAKTEIAKLKDKGQLLLEEPKVAAEAAPEKKPDSAAPQGKEGTSRSGVDIDLDEPDPEADEDL